MRHFKRLYMQAEAVEQTARTSIAKNNRMRMMSITRSVTILALVNALFGGNASHSQVNPAGPLSASKVPGEAPAHVAGSGLLFRAPGGEQQGYIDQRGVLVIPFRYNHAFPFDQDGFALVSTGPTGGNEHPFGKPAIINRRGETVHSGGTFIRSLGRGRFAVGEEDRIRFISLGGEKFEVAANCTSAYGPSSEGMIPVAIGEKWGFLDDNGKLVIEARYDSVGLFSEGLASADSGGKSGYIDHEGKWVIPPGFEIAEAFREGLGAVMEGGQAWYIDRSGKRAIEGNHTHVSPFSEGLGLVELADSRLKGYITKVGALKIPAVYRIARSFKEGLAFVEIRRGERGYIDHTGKMVIRLPDNCISQVDFEHGRALITTKDKIGYIDRTGSWIWIAPQ